MVCITQKEEKMQHDKKRLKKSLILFVTTSLLSIPSALATQINFTNGIVTLNDSTTGITDNSAVFEDVAKYVESGFQFDFLFSGPPTPFASIVGDYYSTGNDVAHWHWEDGGFGEVSEVRVSKVDGTTFDLGGFRVSTNTANGGTASNGNERVSINTDKANSIFNITPDDWGLGNGPDPLITISAGNTLFNDILWFSFTNDFGSSAVGMGLDNFFLDELGDPGGTDPTTEVPLPATTSLLMLGIALIMRRRRPKKYCRLFK